MMRSRLRGYHGIDIGGTKIELVAFHDDEHGLREVHRERIPTPGTDFAEFVQSMQALVARADVELDMRAAVGIGLPGVVDTVSGRQLSSNVPALNGRVVASALQEALQRPLQSATTASASPCRKPMAVQPMRCPACSAPLSAPAPVAAIASTAGCCAASTAWPANGATGPAGRPAAAIPAAFAACACGRSGCVERYVSGPGMSQLHRHLGGDGAPPHAIAAQAAAGSQLAQQTLALHLDLLAHAWRRWSHAGPACDRARRRPFADEPPVPATAGGREAPPVCRRDRAAHPAARFGDAGGARGAALLARQLYP
jgi:N-acetylglucosamine kinase